MKKGRSMNLPENIQRKLVSAEEARDYRIILKGRA